MIIIRILTHSCHPHKIFNNVSFRNGKPTDYTGGRTADSIVSFINKKTGPASHEVSCDDLAGKVTGKLNAVWFGDFSGEGFDNYMSVAKASEGYSFYHAAGRCASTHGTKANSVSIFRTFDSSPIHHSGANTVESISQWLEASAIPTVIEFSEDYIEPIFGKGKAAVILFTNDRDASFNKVFTQAAETMNG